MQGGSTRLLGFSFDLQGSPQLAMTSGGGLGQCHGSGEPWNPLAKIHAWCPDPLLKTPPPNIQVAGFAPFIAHCPSRKQHFPPPHFGMMRRKFITQRATLSKGFGLRAPATIDAPRASLIPRKPSVCSALFRFEVQPLIFLHPFAASPEV